MKMNRLRIPQKHATWVVLAMAAAVTTALALMFPFLSFLWLAWGALGYFAIVTVWRDCIVVVRRAEVASPDDPKRTTIAIYAGTLVAFAVTVLGFLELIQMSHVLIGLAAILIFQRLVKQTLGKR
jgi:hypothetical protein